MVTWCIQNSSIQNNPIQNSRKNHVVEEKTVQYKTVRFKVGDGRARFSAITGCKLRIKSYPLLASSQHVGATAVVFILFIMLTEQRTIIGLPAC